MSLAAQIQGALASHLPALGDLRRPLVITRQVTGAYNPQTQEHDAGAGDGDSWSALAIEDEFKGESMNGVTIQEGDLHVFVEYTAATFAPEPGMTAEYQGKAYRVKAVYEIAQALYELHLRRPE